MLLDFTCDRPRPHPDKCLGRLILRCEEGAEGLHSGGINLGRGLFEIPCPEFDKGKGRGSWTYRLKAKIGPGGHHFVSLVWHGTFWRVSFTAQHGGSSYPLINFHPMPSRFEREEIL
jgi:hypothetical protein